MSADNGIYILETINSNESVRSMYPKEYRIKHLQAIENINYDKDAPEPIRPDYGNRYIMLNEMLHEEDMYYTQHKAYQTAYANKYDSDKPDVHISNARQMWKGCTVFYTKEEAYMEADKQAYDVTSDEYCPILEYGISVISINRVF